MRCLNCLTENIPWGTERCPNPACQTSLRSQMQDVLPPGTRLRNGTIRIEYPLGRGGFGITYLATHLVYNQPVAVKEYFVKDVSIRETRSGVVEVGVHDQDSFRNGLKKFLREGQILAHLDHPGIVRVRDLFPENGTAYLVMEYLQGETLKTRLSRAASVPIGSKPTRFGPLPEPEVRRIMDSLVESLAVLHQQGICHLDIKPSNIILEPDGRIVLIDFGASRQGVARPGHAVSIMAYTPGYAPPELQGINPEFGPESDIYETAMLLHEMLTGDLPPPAEQRLTVRWQPSHAPAPYQALLTQALELERSRRPRDIRSWWKARETFTRGQNLPLVYGSGAVALLSVGLFVAFLLNPKASILGNQPGNQNTATSKTPSGLIKTKATVATPTAEPKAILCAESGGLAREKCPRKEVPISAAKGKKLCEAHALRCKECGHIWSLYYTRDQRRNFCTDESHTPETGQPEDPRFAEEILKLVEVPAVSQPDGVTSQAGNGGQK